MPFKTRWIWLLLASYFFYGFWKIEFAGLMLLTSLIDWYCAKRVSQTEVKKSRLFWMWMAVGTDLAMLFMFKYFDFALGNTPVSKYLYDNNLTAWIIELGKYTIPAGISFYTFQSISYVVDVYRKLEKPEPNPIKFLLFVSFFPQLVAGPIERFGLLHGQLFTKYLPKLEDIKNGFRLMLFGMFLKVGVADNLASIVDVFYAETNKFGVLDTWLATFAFTFQVYYDFFGYSLLAQGSALLFGIHLMDNFNKPFQAGSIPEFWHRWHISLSTWFRDYIFIPVGGNKHGKLVLSLAVLLVFFTSGLWHGANSTMIYFGLSQGVVYLFDRFVIGRRGSESVLGLTLRRIKTAFFFMMTLVFFRSNTLNQSFDVYKQLVGFKTNVSMDAAGANLNTLQHLSMPVYIMLFLGIAFVLDHFIMKVRVDKWLGLQNVYVRWVLYLGLISAVLLKGGAVNHPFVYFQF
jgi:D-alanyl-lipoteichoic acid acyltransferase DltB (MBOAT superfamily)